MGSVVLMGVRKCEQGRITMLLKHKLKLIREHLNLTQDQMAEKLLMTSDSRRSRVSEWESGRGEPRREILIRYSDLVNIDVRVLIDDREVLVLE